MPTRSLEDLHPFVKAKAERFLAKAKDQGIDVLITCTYRSIAEQEAEYAKGRTAPGKIVTNARGGQSPHNYRLAFDCVPVDAHGQPIWDTPQPVWQQLYRIAEEVGLDALGDKWGEFVSWDPGHCQEPGWRYLKDVAG